MQLSRQDLAHAYGRMRLIRDFETRVNQLAGVVCVGLFAHRPADLLILGGDEGISTLHRQATAQVHHTTG